VVRISEIQKQFPLAEHSTTLVMMVRNTPPVLSHSWYMALSFDSQGTNLTFTNNAATLAESLNHDVTKASALDLGKSQNPIANVRLEQAPTLKTTPGAGLGLTL
jgi:hypothetical protein